MLFRHEMLAEIIGIGGIALEYHIFQVSIAQLVLLQISSRRRAAEFFSKVQDFLKFFVEVCVVNPIFSVFGLELRKMAQHSGVST